MVEWSFPRQGDQSWKDYVSRKVAKYTESAMKADRGSLRTGRATLTFASFAVTGSPETST